MHKIPTFSDSLQMLNVFIDEICLFEQLGKFAYSKRICFNCLKTLRDSHCRSVQPFTSERFWFWAPKPGFLKCWVFFQRQFLYLFVLFLSEPKIYQINGGRHGLCFDFLCTFSIRNVLCLFGQDRMSFTSLWVFYLVKSQSGSEPKKTKVNICKSDISLGLLHTNKEQIDELDHRIIYLKKLDK